MAKNLSKQISIRIKEEIEFSGFTHREIADALGVTPPTISQYLSGKIQPSLATLSKLCSFLGCSSDDILGVTKDDLNKSNKKHTKKDN